MKQPAAPKTPKHAPHHPAAKKATATKTVAAKKPAVAHGHQKKPKPAPKPKRPAGAHHKVRKFSPGRDVACCAAEALGALVIASGAPWSAGDTLALYRSTTRSTDAGASVLATFKEGQEIIKGRPSFAPVDLTEDLLRDRLPVTVPPDSDLDLVPVGHSLILGVTLPEPHAVAVTPDGRWWSWGEPFSPGDWPELVVEEVWAVLL